MSKHFKFKVKLHTKGYLRWYEIVNIKILLKEREIL